MKIEKINDNQIRCTLNRGDLQERQLSLKELAYGTEKARSLFREMIQKAMAEVGFDTNDIPLMIEAIPLSGEGIMLIITKIEDPEELDTRFAKFAPSIEAGLGDAPPANIPLPTSAEDILNALNTLFQNKETDTEKEKEQPTIVDLSRCFVFHRLDDVMEAADVLSPIYHGKNTLYLSPDGLYYLVAHKSDHSPEEFNKICNIFTEYGEKVRTGNRPDLYYQEHYECIIPDQAIQSLAVTL